MPTGLAEWRRQEAPEGYKGVKLQTIGRARAIYVGDPSNEILDNQPAEARGVNQYYDSHGRLDFTVTGCPAVKYPAVCQIDCPTVSLCRLSLTKKDIVWPPGTLILFESFTEEVCC